MIIRSTILAARIIFFSNIIWDSSSFWPNNLQYTVLNHIISIAILRSDFRSQIIRLCFNTFWYIHFALLLFCYLVYLFHPEALLRTRMQRTHHKSPIGSQCPKSLFLAVAPFEHHLPVFDQFIVWYVLILAWNVSITICDIIDAIKSLFYTFIWLFIVCVALSTNENWFWSFFSAIDDASEAMESLLSSCYNQMKNHSNIMFSIYGHYTNLTLVQISKCTMLALPLLPYHRPPSYLHYRHHLPHHSPLFKMIRNGRFK